LIIKGWREENEDKVVEKDVVDDFVKQWVVAHAKVAGKVVVGLEVPPIIG
jgi:hypothetical protein